MQPKGHLITAAGLSAGVFAATGSPALTAGTFAGGFLIDLDHYADYLFFERQRDPRPSRFLHYYKMHQYEWVVLGLHSYELFGLLAVAAWFFPQPLLVGYLAGATMHLGLDLVFNRPVIQRPVAFYLFGFRAMKGFRKKRLLNEERLAEAARQHEKKLVRGNGSAEPAGTAAVRQEAPARID